MKTGGRIYIGDALAHKRYLLNTKIRAARSMSVSWIPDDFSAITAFEFDLLAEKSAVSGVSETRTFKGCSNFLIMALETFESKTEADLKMLEEAAFNMEDNPNYKTFPIYAKEILGESMKSPETLSTSEMSDVSTARKYQKAIEQYFEDVYYSSEKVAVPTTIQGEDFVLIQFPKDKVADLIAEFTYNSKYEVISLKFKCEIKEKESEERENEHS